MTNYFKKILTSGLIAGAIALTSACGSDNDGPFISQDTYVSDAYVSQDTFADTNIDNLADVFEQLNTKQEVNEDANVEDSYIGAEVNEDANSDVEEELICNNLNEVPYCLGEEYNTLVSSGLEVNKALDLGYAGVTTNQDTENPNIISGSPCSLPNYFDQTCVEWATSNPAGLSSVKLTGQDTIEIKGNLLERITALTKLVNGEVQGTECIITGTDPNTAEVLCNEQPDEE